ncbi:MAG TPA: citryl-CoA lyase [Candidatus Binatia bacterium]|jgi:citrate synthase
MTKRYRRISPQAWWSTAIIEMKPGMIRYRGYAVEDLIGHVGFAEMVWLLTRGDLPTPAEAKLLEAALVTAVDHGPQAPSIAVARMAITCGVGINNAMASAINVLGDIHGGAGEQCVAFYNAVAKRLQRTGADTKDRRPIAASVEAEIDALANQGVKYVPGFGHRFHPADPRAPRLLQLVEKAAAAGHVSGLFAAIGRAAEKSLARRKDRTIPMNIDGATAVVFAELGFPPPLCRGLFVLSRSVGILAHAWEESQSGERNKGPMPRNLLWNYKGPKPRPFRRKTALRRL